MREWKRILLSPVWLGVLALLVVCHGGLFLQNQSVRAGGDLARYSQETNRWEAELQSLSLPEGQARLAEARQARSGWDMARMVITFEEAGLTIQEEELDYYRTEYADFDAMVAAVRDGTAPAEDVAGSIALEQWETRLAYLSGYGDSVAAVTEQAERIRSNPLFASSGSFDWRNAALTAGDYAPMADIPLEVAADDVIVSYLSDRTALIFGLCLMAVTVVLLLEPRRLGLEQVERSAANGRTVLALWRLGCVGLSALIATLAIQGSTLLCAMAAYRHGLDLSLSVQSFAFFQHWTRATSLGGFLLWHGALRWAGLALAGLLFWLALGRIRSLPLGLVVCGAVLLVEWRWFTAYGVNDAGYPLAAVNLFHLLSPEELAGRYLNYNLFGHPVRERTLMGVILLLLLLLCAGALVLTAHRSRGRRGRRLLAQYLQRVGEWLRSKRRPRSLWVYEGRKVLLYSGGIVLLAAVCLFLWTRQAPVGSQSREEALLTQFVRVYAGEVTPAKLEEIQGLRQEADAAYDAAFTSGGGGNETEYLAARSWALAALEERCQNLLERQAAGERGLRLVDEQPLERIFGSTGASLRLTEACAALLGLCLSIPGLFAIERRNGMELSLRSAARGRDALWRRKLGWAMAMAALLWVAWTLRELWLLHSIGLSLGDLPAAGASLDYWNGALGSMPLWGYLALFYLLRLIGLLGAAALMLFLSARFPALLSAGGIGAAVLLLPALLSLVGAGWLDVVSWAASLGGWDLVIRRKALVWLAVWIVTGGAALWASRREWRRYRA